MEVHFLLPSTLNHHLELGNLVNNMNVMSATSRSDKTSSCCGFLYTIHATISVTSACCLLMQCMVIFCYGYVMLCLLMQCMVMLCYGYVMLCMLMQCMVVHESLDLALEL